MAARRTTSRAKMSIPMYLACVLLCLTLISIRLSSGVVARYSTTTDSGDGARVIYFKDLAVEVTDGGYIAPGVALELNARITFGGSESATYVFAEVAGVASADATTVTLFAGGPSWSVDTATWTYLPGASSGTYVYYLELAPNDTLNEVPLFESSLSTPIRADMTAEQIEALGGFSPKFYASVVQSNGFDTPQQAWESLETNHSR